MNYKLKQKPDLSRLALFNLSFGFFGVQIAYALQSSNISRIFATMGADPKSLSFFWVLPPLMGMIVQPIVGMLSDRTWCRFGRRIPYLIVGAVIAVIVMTLLPNAGSLSDTFWVAMTLGAVILMFLDTSLNMAMQPFKMMVGDVVNEKQKGLAYAIQSFLCNLGQVVGFSRKAERPGLCHSELPVQPRSGGGLLAAVPHVVYRSEHRCQPRRAHFFKSGVLCGRYHPYCLCGLYLS